MYKSRYANKLVFEMKHTQLVIYRNFRNRKYPVHYYSMMY